MNKNEILNKFQKDEDKMLVAKILDKVEQCNKTNKVISTVFLDMYQIKIIEKILNKVNVNYKWFGGVENSTRKSIVLYSNNFNEEFLVNTYENMYKVIRIELPKDLYNTYNHRDYLSGVIKLGIKRECVGDIVVDESGADIICLADVSNFLKLELNNLTRFKKSNISIISLNEIRKNIVKTEERNIIVQSMRLDSIVSELINTSRTMANSIILEGRVFINYENELKNSKLINADDIIVIRGKGKFKIGPILGNTKKDKILLKIYKFV